MKNKLTSLSAALVMAGATLSFNACAEQSPFQPRDEAASNIAPAFAKKHTLDSKKKSRNRDKGRRGKGRALGRKKEHYPQQAEMMLQYNAEENKYSGGSMKIANGSQFTVKGGSFTAPEATTVGPVLLTMVVDKDDKKNEMTFTFGPSGSKFVPAAKVWFAWGDLKPRRGKTPKIFYISPEGKYLEQSPLEVDLARKRTKIEIHHFSRYAAGWGSERFSM